MSDSQALPKSFDEAFDFSTNEVLGWEVERIRQAALQGKYIISDHAQKRMKERGIASKDVRDVLINGNCLSKDLPGNPHARGPGINVEGVIADGRQVRVKVSWRKGYVVVTTHEVRV